MSSSTRFAAPLSRSSRRRRRPRLRAAWLGCMVGLTLTGGLVLPAGASAITTHFTVTNASSYDLKLTDVTAPAANDTPAIINTTSVASRPPDGAVLEPGATAGFDLTYYFLSTNGARADYSLLDGNQTVGTVHATMVQYGLGGVRTDCRVDAASEMCIGPGQNSKSVTVVDPPGTVRNVPAAVKQQQADALQTLCISGSAATCSFTAKEQEHLESQGHQVGGYVDNPANFDEQTRIKIEDSVGTSDSVDVGLTAGTELFDLVKAEIEVRYTHDWTQEHVFGQEVDLTVPSHKRCWFVATSPIVRYTGDFKATLGNTTWNLTDIYFDGPDTYPSPPAASWGYTPKCVDLPPSTGVRGPAPGSKLVLRGGYKSPASASIDRPRLKLAIVGPSRLVPEASTAYRIVLSRSRPGRRLSYTPQDVRVRVRLGHREVGRWRVRTLSAGHPREFPIAVRTDAASSGRICLTATASARNAIGARTTHCLRLSASTIAGLG
jgi:hypothetical protein